MKYNSPPAESTSYLDQVKQRPPRVLCDLGSAVRRRRAEYALTLRELADRAGVSERFLVSLESGKGNISVLRLSEVAEALGTSAADLLSPQEEARLRIRTVALVGLRGAGKSTIGRRVSEALGVEFVEVDELVAAESAMTLSALFEAHGEAQFRVLERRVLERLFASPTPRIVATSGSIVTHSETYAWLRAQATTVWLRATPEDHLERVIAQGDRRPMEGRPRAMHELRDLLAARKPLYSQAEHTIDTSALGLARATQRVLQIARRTMKPKPRGAGQAASRNAGKKTGQPTGENR
jgi:XRE family aerobic/anaerobic benzoate catabolism transcriptional regulator